MQTVKQLFGLGAVNGDIGIEIEAEGKGLKFIEDNTWTTKDDGSLRGLFPYERSEYVLIKPIKINTVEKALDSLINHQKGAKFNFSHRTSVHVHVNVSDMTEVKFLNFVYAAYLLEDVLINFCGRERKGNKFCLRLRDAEGIIFIIKEMISNGLQHLHRWGVQEYKYASINLTSVYRYGSLEFRGMRGTLDKEILTTWIKALYNLKLFANSMEDPIEIHDLFCEVGAEEFIKMALKEQHPAFLYNQRRMQSDIMQGFSLSLDIPYEYKAAEEAKKQVKPRKSAVIDEEFNKLMEGNLRDIARVGPVPRLHAARFDILIEDDLVNEDDLVDEDEGDEEEYDEEDEHDF